MPKAKNFRSLVLASVKATRPSPTAGARSAKTSRTRGRGTGLKNYISAIDTTSQSVLHSSSKRLAKFLKPPSVHVNTSSPASLSILSDLNLEVSMSDSGEAPNVIVQDISTILSDDASLISPDSQGSDGKRTSENNLNIDSQGIDGKKTSENKLDIPWISNLSHKNVSVYRKELCRVRKGTWIFKSTQVNRFDKLVKMCGEKIGTDATVDVFGKLGRETGVKEYNALIKICIETARQSDDEDVVLQQISVAFRLLKLMKEQGFQMEEGSYGPCLMYFIDMGLVKEFNFFSELIKDGEPSPHSKFGYYEMLLYIKVNNNEKIEELCNHISNKSLNETINLQENYMSALCEMDRKDELLQLLKIVDITKFSSLHNVVSIFKFFGRLSLESQAMKILLEFKECDYATENISTLIFSYATSIPNLPIEDVILKFNNLHSVLEIQPSSKSCEKLILHSCELFKVNEALDIVDQICEGNLTLSIEMLNIILRASEKSFEFNLVHRIYSLICRHELEPNDETIRIMISLMAKMKDFAGAYDMLDHWKKLNKVPTASMYNAILAGYFREKNINGALTVLKRMKEADIKPDSQTYCYLITNCESEDQIIKYYEEMENDNTIQFAKQIFMALINAYAACGCFEKAKQVLLDNRIPSKNLNEIRSVLVSALASHGQMSDALNVYEEIKKHGNNLEPKAVICLIEHLQSEGEVSRLLKLLEELQDPDYWLDGCCRVILFCIRTKHLSSAVSLLKQLKDRLNNDELIMQVVFDEVFSVIAETESTYLQIGLDLFQVIKNELCFSPSRKSLDFLLSACVKARDLQNCRMIWKEYPAAGYPYNVMSYLRMYQALLASGDHKSAKKMLSKISKDDDHVHMMIQACQETYIKSTSVKKKKNKKE